MTIRELNIPIDLAKNINKNEKLTLAEHYLKENVFSGVSIEIPSLNISISISKDKDKKKYDQTNE